MWEDGGNGKHEKDREKGKREQKRGEEKGRQRLKEGKLYTEITQGTRDK